jgi:hypothetical protein
MLDWLQDVVAPIRKRDSRFGELRFMRTTGFWEGRTPFRPLGRAIEVLVWGHSGGPSDEQRAFFDVVEERYDSLWPLIKERLDTEARSVGAASDVFDLVAVSVPAEPGPSAAWELSYETRPPSWHFTVRMAAWAPGEIVAEC